jgi:choline dehydrogenase-like flavoprotein
VEHIKDYPTTLLNPWDFKHRLTNPERDVMADPVQSAAYDESSKHFFVRDSEHPYIQETPFSWIRGYQVGGRSLTWGRQCYRLSELDFAANAQDGYGVDWPIRYKDIAPWYDYVETYAGISGQAEGLPHLPDGQFLPAMEMNCLELHFREELKKKYNDRLVTIARVANLTKGWNGRLPCQYRNLCHRGCPYGGYFSSNAATLPAAKATNNLTLRPFSTVASIIYDKDKKKAIGVHVIDTETKESYEYYARIIFLNASTIATAAILLNSVSDAFPNGLGNGSDQVGRNLMDHHFKVGAKADFDGLHDRYYIGRRPTGIYLPRFRNLDEATKMPDYVRGFGYQGYGEREAWMDNYGISGFGEDFKKSLTAPGKWTMWLGGWGEMLPYAFNRVTLDTAKLDPWGLPQAKISFELGGNEMNMRTDMKQSAMEMLERSGFTNISGFDYNYIGGECVHEMGTARMGNDPATSVLNKWNQMHEVQNVFVTDGSCMTSSACQNPSLTYMALTARACDHAVGEMKKRNL